MSISAAEASRLTGKSKQAIINSIKLGKVSAVKDVDGTWQIEPVELFRHYQAVSSDNGNGHQALDTQLDDTRQELDASLQVEIKLLRELLAQSDATVIDLRQRLDAATEENQRLTAVLTTQLSPSPKARTGWWQRLLGGGE